MELYCYVVRLLFLIKVWMSNFFHLKFNHEKKLEFKNLFPVQLLLLFYEEILQSI